MDNLTDSIGSNKSVTVLPLAMCIILNLPRGHMECSTRMDDPNCIFCPIDGKFVTGEGMDDYSSPGHFLSLVLGGISVIIGTCGTFMSCLIITVLRRQNSGRSFDILLTALACFDLLCSVMVVVCAASLMIWFQNYSRNLATLSVWLVSILAILFARSGSVFMTVAITLERYLLIAFPVPASRWFTPVKTKMVAGFVFLFACFTGFPRFSSVYIGKNTGELRGIPSTQELDYLIYSTIFEKFFYVDLKAIFDQIDFLAPFPILIIFNGMIFYYIRKFSERRQELNMKQQKALSAGQMFIPVVVVLFLCNIEPIVHHYHVLQGTIYREGMVGVLLSAAVNSAANLPIYYWKASSFRKEAKVVLASWFPWVSNGRRGRRRVDELKSVETRTSVLSSNRVVTVTTSPASVSSGEDYY